MYYRFLTLYMIVVKNTSVIYTATVIATICTSLYFSFLLCLSTFLWFPFSTLLGRLWLHMTLTTCWLRTTSNSFTRFCLCCTQILPTSALINRSWWWCNTVRTANMALTGIMLCFTMTWRFYFGVLECATVRRVSSTAVETWWQARLCCLRPIWNKGMNQLHFQELWCFGRKKKTTTHWKL